MALEPTPTVYVALDLLTWHEQGSLVLSPKFQRRGVWSSAARSYFIDTILRGYPVPPLHLRLVRDKRRGGVVREVIDGQQRLRALFGYVSGEYRLSRNLDADWAGKTYDELPDSSRQQLEDFRFQVYHYQNIDDETVLEVFSRINTYSVALNAQELRHGKYFGEFRQAAYSLALERLEFWRSSRIFTEAAIARMSEAELVSELLVLQLDGLQDKKKSLDEFYRNLDEEWNRDGTSWTTRVPGSRDERTVPAVWISRKESEDRFNNVIDSIVDAVGGLLPQSEFRRVPLFHSLYSAVYHRQFGLPLLDVPTPKRTLDAGARLRLRSTVEELSELVSEKPKIDELTSWRRTFVVASSRQTDNIGPRRDRFNVVWGHAGLGE